MKFIDPHIHMYSRTTDDYEKMSLAGIEVVVQPSFWLGAPRTNVGSFIDYWDHMITFETKRAKDFGIEHYTCISVNPKESTERPLALDALDEMIKKGFLNRERVVAIGEIGFNLINDEEEEIFVHQLELGQKENYLILIHLPHQNKTEGMKRMKAIFEKGKYDFNRILIDHNTEETIKSTLELGAWAGLTVYPVTKLSPNRAINIIKEHGSDRIMINSSADWGVSDPLSVPLVAREMRKKGCKSSDIEKVTFYNAYEYYKQSDKFHYKVH
jgi:uncharacterized protein